MYEAKSILCVPTFKYVKRTWTWTRVLCVRMTKNWFNNREILIIVILIVNSLNSVQFM